MVAKAVAVAFLALALGGCAGLLDGPSPRVKDMAECVKRGIHDAQACEAAYDTGKI